MTESGVNIRPSSATGRTRAVSTRLSLEGESSFWMGNTSSLSPAAGLLRLSPRGTTGLSPYNRGRQNRTRLFETSHNKSGTTIASQNNTVLPPLHHHNNDGGANPSATTWIPHNNNNNNTKNLNISTSCLVDGMNLDDLRVLATRALSETGPQQQEAVFYASLLYAKQKNIAAHALLLARAYYVTKQYSSCLRLLQESNILRHFPGVNQDSLGGQQQQPSGADWMEGLLLACQALAACQEWTALIEMAEDACRLSSLANNDGLGSDSEGFRPHFSNLASSTTTNLLSRPLEDEDDFGWDTLQEYISNILSYTHSHNNTNTPPIHPLARLCVWRGRAYYETGHPLRAAVFWKRALVIDVRAVDAFLSLVDHALVTPLQAQALLQPLDFSAHPWLQNLYWTRIEVYSSDQHNDNNFTTSKYNSFTQTPTSMTIPQQVDQAFQQLETVYKLQDSPQVLAMAAKRAYRRYQWHDVLKYCRQLAEMDPTLQTGGAGYTYVATLLLLGHKRTLFQLAHEWNNSNCAGSSAVAATTAQAWFAVGAYYSACGRHHVAQRHFCRATRLLPNCAEAWIAFGCSFAACDESDQALASFRAAQRLSPAEHTALLYMGMEYNRTNHLTLAQNFLTAALQNSGGNLVRTNSSAEDGNVVSVGGDPLCWHELGVLAMHRGQYQQAVECFVNVLKIVVMGVLHPSEGENGKDHGGNNLNDTQDTTSDQRNNRMDGSADGIILRYVEGCVDPYWEPTVFNLGHALRKLRRYELACEAYGRCIALCPDKCSGYSAYAFACQCRCYCMGDVDKDRQDSLLDRAVENYHKALACKPDDAFSAEMLARALGSHLQSSPVIRRRRHSSSRSGSVRERMSQIRPEESSVFLDNDHRRDDDPARDDEGDDEEEDPSLTRRTTGFMFPPSSSSSSLAGRLLDL